MRLIHLSFDSHSEELLDESSEYVYRRQHIGKLGASFEAIMNLNCRQASKVIRGYHLADGAIDSFDVVQEILACGKAPNPGFVPPNYKSIFQQLVEISPVFSSFYQEGDWAELIYDFYDGPIGGGDLCSNIQHDISKVEEFLILIEQNPNMFTCDFLEYLNEYELLPPLPTDYPSANHHYMRDKQCNIPANASLSNQITNMYSDYISSDSSRDLSYTYHFHSDNRLSFALAASLIELARNSKCIRKCKNCGRYFVPENRSDTIYCDNPSPNTPSMTCKEYGSQRLWYERQKDDELATLSRNILSAKSMLAKRNQDMPEYQISYDYFRKERIKWKKEVESGTKTREEYQSWLLYMQSQKRIKEALHGDNPRT